MLETEGDYEKIGSASRTIYTNEFGFDHSSFRRIIETHARKINFLSVSKRIRIRFETDTPSFFEFSNFRNQSFLLQICSGKV